jgi:glutathione S-transferase
VIALVDHLDFEIERRESMVGDLPEGIADYSSSGAIPLLVDGDLVITESRVMLEHLAERQGFDAAYPEDLASRTRHRHAMAVTDENLVPALSGAESTRRIPETLDALEAVADGEPTVCLMTLHIAPIWLRLRLWQPRGDFARAIEARPSLRRWLDDTVALPCIARTSPDPKVHAQDLARAREAGLMPAE